MEVRQTLNRHPVWTALAVGFVLVVSIAWMIKSNRPPSHGKGIPDSEFFTDDDGQSYFVAEYKNVPPFDHNGKPAFRAAVFVCGEGGRPFVGYVEKFNPEDRVQVEQMVRNFKPNSYGPPPFIYMGARAFVKAPGEGNEWVQQMDQARAKPIMEVKCPDGTIARRIQPQRD